ncbi:unnamed protein product [Allacma fusca]|uniref:Uncharacterized protein n=1 Tax=Allacma fusca TaxID=39272 RepID=A0A8J2P1F1_9HEXA|nr:unnamed protein product [Allacma fusca]
MNNPNTIPTSAFHIPNDPEELPGPISEDIGKVLYNCSKNACFLKTVPMELVPGTNNIRACRSKLSLARFWLSWILMVGEASYGLLKFAYVTHYDIPVTKFGYLYSGIMTGMYWSGVVIMTLSFLRRYEIQEFINTVTYFNQYGGPQKNLTKRIDIMYLLLRFLPLGMYLLGASNCVVFLASKTAPITIYSSLDPSYRDKWFILVLHTLHDIVIPSYVNTTILFILLYILGYTELVKLQCNDYL